MDNFQPQFPDQPDAEDELDALDEFPEEPIEEDLPCIRCGYNLRGLKPDGQCPECGAKIAKALRFANERQLCPACMAPNHPSVALCSKCGSPMSGAAGLAGYYQTVAVAGYHTKNSPSMDESPTPPSLQGLIVTWIFFGPILLFILFSVFADLFLDGGPLRLNLLSAFVLGLIPFAVVYLVTSNYIRKTRSREHGFEPVVKSPPSAPPAPETAESPAAPDPTPPSADPPG